MKGNDVNKDGATYLPNSKPCFICGEDNPAGVQVRFLVEDAGLPSSLMEIEGYGKRYPVERGEAPEARARNRRVEVTLTIRR